MDVRQLAVAYVDCLEQRDWARLTGLLADDVVYEMPQTRERIRGHSAFLRFNQEYPGDWHMVVHRVAADGAQASLWLDVRVGDERTHACVWLDVDVTAGRITRIVDFWPDPYDPPAGREHLTERW